jgi:hypothetical protein
MNIRILVNCGLVIRSCSVVFRGQSSPRMLSSLKKTKKISIPGPNCKQQQRGLLLLLFIFLIKRKPPIYLALLSFVIMADTNKINVVVKTSSGAKYDISTEKDITVEEFKKLLEQQSQIPAEQQRLIYSGHVLRNEQKLSDFGK